MENSNDGNIFSFLRDRVPSPLHDVATAPARTVPEVEPPADNVRETPAEDLRNADDGRRRFYDNDDDDDDEDPVLSGEEIAVMAESKAVKWGIGTTLAANAINAVLILSPREWQIYHWWREHELDDPDKLPIAPPIVRRILNKIEKLDRAKDENALTDKEQKMLAKAIKAELTVKNKAGRLNRSGVVGTVADILIAKAAPGITEGIFRGVNALMNRITGPQK